VTSLGIKNVREGNQCERCKKDVSQVGPTDYFEEYDLVLCEKCAEETIKEKNLKCPKCKKVVSWINRTSWQTDVLQLYGKRQKQRSTNRKKKKLFQIKLVQMDNVRLGHNCYPSRCILE